MATDRCHELAKLWPAESHFPTHLSLPLDFRHPDRAAEAIVAAAQSSPWSAIVPSSDETALIASLATERLGLPGNSPEATYAARNKLQMRERLRAASVPVPEFAVFSLTDTPSPPEAFPCVVKPLLLSASRGVIRADDPASLREAFARVTTLLRRPELAAGEDPAREQILVESFVDGIEVALEGILKGGALEVLALFDKPDPLDGPYFEETLYVTPSRLPKRVLEALVETAERAALALGLREGPVHAELRWNDRGPWVIEVAARPIGGLCSRTLRFGLGDHSLEELILRRALGDSTRLPLQSGAAGVMMIPIPRAGVLQTVAGETEARAVAGIEAVEITTRIGEKLVPLPEGASYLGFVFARADGPQAVEAALREAHARLRFSIAAVL